LSRLSVDQAKGSAQRLVQDPDPVQRTAQGNTVQPVFQPQSERNVICLAPSICARNQGCCCAKDEGGRSPRPADVIGGSTARMALS
jgi:hypothetical protein